MYADECCRLADIDGDGDVDLEDYAAFQLFFGKYCVLDADCGDGLFCTGEEICIAGSCAAGNAPCSDPNFSICDEELDDCLPTIRYQDDFSAYPCDGDPEDWLDTAANNSMVPDDGQFEVGCPDGNHVLRAATSQVNVHSHYAPPGSEDWPVQSFTGRIFTSTVSAGIGVTFHSDYPNSDTYYRLRRGSFAGGTAFHVDAHGTTITGGTTSSGVAPAANVWYWFRIELADTGTETQIRAKIWPMGDAEPVDWQIDCYDSSSTRRTAGRIGVWSMYAVKSYWDDFEVK
jgi:hypothetical protein